MNVDWDKFSDGWASGSMVCERCKKVFENVRFLYSCHDKIAGVWPICCGHHAKFKNDWKPEMELIPKSGVEHMDYNITITREQAKTLVDALEIYARLKLGQIDIAIENAFIDKLVDRSEVERHCENLKQLFFPELTKNASYGVGAKVYPRATTAWDIMQVIRHKLAWDQLKESGKEKPDFYGVQYNKAMKFGEEPLITIKDYS